MFKRVKRSIFKYPCWFSAFVGTESKCSRHKYWSKAIILDWKLRIGKGLGHTNLTMASWLKEEICISLHYLYFKMLFLLQLWKTEDVCLSCARNCNRSSHHIIGQAVRCLWCQKALRKLQFTSVSGSGLPALPFIWNHWGMMNDGCLHRKWGSH